MIVVLLGVSASGSAACSSDDTTNATTTPLSPKAVVCAARDDLATSVRALTNPSLLVGGKAGVSTAVADVTAKLAALKSAGVTAYATELDAVSTSLAGLSSAASSISGSSLTADAQRVGTAISAVGASVATLGEAIGTDCP